MIHSLHRCLRWCLWCSAITGTQWSRITSHVSFTHIHIYSQTWGLWCLLHHYKMELLSDIIMYNDHNPLQKFLTGKNANNKVNWWSLEPATHYITFKWISGACNKTAGCLTQWIKVPTNPAAASIPINMVVAFTPDGPATHTHSKTKTSTATMLLLMFYPHHKGVLLQMQKTDPFCKCISKWLFNGKAPHHKAYTFTHINDLLYKHAMDATQKFLALVIPKSWHFTVLIKVHEKLGHQGINRTYHVIKQQYYWKGMNNDICKYTAKCVLYKRERAKMQMYPLQMMHILDWPFDKIAIDLITELNITTSGNQHNLTIIDHLTGWPEAFPIPNKKADTIVCVFISNYLPTHMCPRFILLDNGMEFKNLLMDDVLNNLASVASFPPLSIVIKAMKN